MDIQYYKSLSNQYKLLGDKALEKEFAELENNLWEEGWGGNPLSYRPVKHKVYVEIMLRTIGEISTMYKDYDDFWNKVKTFEEAYHVAQPIFNRWASILYPDTKLINGLGKELNYGKEED